MQQEKLSGYKVIGHRSNYKEKHNLEIKLVRNQLYVFKCTKFNSVIKNTVLIQFMVNYEELIIPCTELHVYKLPSSSSCQP